MDQPEEAALARITPIISHEIRNPLAVIGNSSYFIKSKLGASADAKVLKHIGIIESEVRRANEVLGEILAYARMREPSPSSQRLNGLMEEATKDLADPRRLALEPAPGDPRVLADSELAKQALRHVVRNALEAVSQGNEPIKVSAGVSGTEGYVEVSDTGPGISPAVVDKLFTPFTTDKPRGVGLGLAFARKALTRQGGRIELLKSNKGCRFRLSLPVA